MINYCTKLIYSLIYNFSPPHILQYFFLIDSNKSIATCKTYWIHTIAVSHALRHPDDMKPIQFGVTNVAFKQCPHFLTSPSHLYRAINFLKNPKTNNNNNPLLQILHLLILHDHHFHHVSLQLHLLIATG